MRFGWSHSSSRDTLHEGCPVQIDSEVLIVPTMECLTDLLPQVLLLIVFWLVEQVCQCRCEVPRPVKLLEDRPLSVFPLYVLSIVEIEGFLWIQQLVSVDEEHGVRLVRVREDVSQRNVDRNVVLEALLGQVQEHAVVLLQELLLLVAAFDDVFSHSQNMLWIALGLPDVLKLGLFIEQVVDDMKV